MCERVCVCVGEREFIWNDTLVVCVGECVCVCVRVCERECVECVCGWLREFFWNDTPYQRVQGVASMKKNEPARCTVANCNY